MKIETQARVLQELARYATRKINNRNILKDYRSSREFDIKENIFKVLVCPEFYMSKEPRELEQHEYFKLMFVLENWKKHTEK